jgi:hypothetical protein
VIENVANRSSLLEPHHASAITKGLASSGTAQNAKRSPVTFAIGRSVGPVTAPNLPLRGRAAVRRYSSLSSNREEIGALGLVSAWTIRATAAECLRPVTSQAIRKHLRDRGVGAGVAPEFMAERNSELVGTRDGTPPTPSVPRLATSRTAADIGRVPLPL